MKKILATVLAVFMVVSMATVVSAANTTTLTTEVPAATYTLTIPADQTIEYGMFNTRIGNVTVTGASGFAVGKNLDVSVVYEPFKCEGVSTTIPFCLNLCTETGGNIMDILSGDALTFPGQSDGTVSETAVFTLSNGHNVNMNDLGVKIEEKAWGKALAGTYSTTLTFTAEVVAAG